ncbi:MAG: GCN5-related N-acetyltransferase [Anaerosporomusa subterranea]|nr:GCN5-related N-acetyltransferase [Anaerosporomusa subterranea]
MSLLSRINSRVREEGYAKTLQYGVLVGADAFKAYLRDTYLDLKYSDRLLRGNNVSNFKHLGANDVFHTDYSVMPLLFRNLPVSPDDVLVDVGCGKGRVINFWLSRKYKNQIIGLEIDPDIAANTARQLANHANVKVIPGDAIENLPSEGTIFYFYNPFNEEKVVKFEQKVRELTRGNQVNIIYYNPKSLHVFENSKWSIQRFDFERDFGVKRWGRLNKYHELAILTKKHPCIK